MNTFFDVLTDNPVDSIVITDFEGTYLAVSEKKAKNWGRTRSQMIGLSDKLLMEPAEAEASWKLSLQVIETGEPVADVEQEVIRDGQALVYSVSKYLSSLIIDGVEKKVVVSISRDITERERLRKAMRLFFTDATHKLKSPFTSIIGMLDRITRGRYGKIENISALNAVEIAKSECLLVQQRASESLKLVEHLCYRNNLDAVSEDENIDIGEEVNDIIDSHSNLLEENNVFIDGFMGLIPPGKVFVKSNRYKFRSVVEELFLNLVKYGKIGRDSLNISYGYWYEPGKLFMNYYSDGAGISEEFLKTGLVCSAFERGSETSELVEGTGLGLYMVEQYMKMMGGGFRFENTPDNHPNCIIWLPIPE